ncbi:MAG: 50S ribosome-binding GTPase, partial [Nanoarchaeota archaeon]|nr:50S ribosome-binding GTPase [Nanoarchaeota archaeon]
MGVKERIQEIEDQLKTTKYNKKTQHAIGLRKAQLAALKKKAEGQKKSGSGYGYVIRKTGDATVVMVGFPSVGKSTLLNAITNQESIVGGYDFTTLEAIPGLLNYKGAKIQIFDVPGLVEGAAAGTGRGKEVLSVVKNADLCLLVVDVNRPSDLEIIKNELYDADIRINTKKPEVKFKKVTKGGITLSKTVPLAIDDQLVKDMLNEMGIINADVLIRSKVNEDQLIDAVIGNRKYLNAVIILNKCDTVSYAKANEIKEKIKADVLVSAERKENL